MGGGTLSHERPNAYAEYESKLFELQLRFWLVVFSQIVLGSAVTQNDYSGEDKEKLLHLMQRHKSHVSAPVFMS